MLKASHRWNTDEKDKNRSTKTGFVTLAPSTNGFVALLFEKFLFPGIWLPLPGSDLAQINGIFSVNSLARCVNLITIQG